MIIRSIISSVFVDLPFDFSSLFNLSSQLGTWCGWLNTYLPMHDIFVCASLLIILFSVFGVIKIIIQLL